MCISQIHSNVSELLQLDILMSLKKRNVKRLYPFPRFRPAPLVSPKIYPSLPATLGESGYPRIPRSMKGSFPAPWLLTDYWYRQMEYAKWILLQHVHRKTGVDDEAEVKS